MQSAQRSTRFTVTVPSSERERALVSLSVWAECICESLTGRTAPGKVELLQERQPGLSRFAVFVPNLSGVPLAKASRSLELLAGVLATEPQWRDFVGRLGPDVAPCTPHPGGGIES